MSRVGVAVVLLGLAVTSLAGCMRVPSGYGSLVLSDEGIDRFEYRARPDGWDVGAADDNRGVNSRVVLWPDGTGVARDQTACVTVTDGGWPDQTGVALRVRGAGPNARAITVTNNIYDRSWFTFNVHVWDMSRPGPEKYQLVRAFDLAALKPDGMVDRGWTWRLCAQAVGSTVRLKVWRPDETEPPWEGDDVHVRSVQLPAGFDGPGRPGLYVGHLVPGQPVSLTDVQLSVVK
jgi:hypothetical protein